MNESFREYGDIILAVIGGLLIILIMGELFVSESGPVVQGIEGWGTEAFE